MKSEEINIQQDVLITRFNQFAKFAKEYLNIDIAPLNERGCCFALAQYNIKHASEGTLNHFYQAIETICVQFTDDYIPKLLAQAKITEDQKIITKAKTGKPLTAHYHNFDFPTRYGPMRFSALMDFVQGVSKAQVGYQSVVAKGRFSERNAQYRMGRLESIAANWESSYIVSGTKKTLADSLTRMHLGDYPYALIQSGNHAINYRRTENNQYVVYDSNDSSYSQTCSTLQEVAEAIIEKFAVVGNLSKTGQVSMSIDTASLKQGDRELKNALLQYRHSVKEEGPRTAIANHCHDILMSYRIMSENGPDVAEKLHAFCSQLKAEGKVKNTRDFIRQLSPSLQVIATDCLNYVKRAEFARVVESKTKIHGDSAPLSAEQKVCFDKINEYLAQYKEGFLSRADFAVNVNAQIRILASHSEAFQALPVHAELVELEKCLTGYLDNTITGAELLRTTAHVDLNARDNTGYSLLDFACEASPNVATMKALFERGEKNGATDFSVDNRRDRQTLIVLLSLGNSELAEYMMTKIDMKKALSADNFSLLNIIVDSGNSEVCKVLIRSLMASPEPPNFDINQKIGDKTLLQYALKTNNPGLALFAVENGAKLSSLGKTELGDLFKASSMKLLEDEYKKSRERQSYTFEQFKDDFKALRKKGYSESDMEKQWAEVQEKEQVQSGNQLSSETRLSEYTFEAFQEEHADRFTTTQAWGAVIDRLIEVDRIEERDPLMNALLQSGRLEQAERLFLKESTESPQWKAHQQALFIAAVNQGDVVRVDKLINQQQNLNPHQVKDLVNYQQAGGKSVLSQACDRGHNAVVKMLVDNGAIVKEDTSAPFAYAVKSCDVETCEYLLQNGASFQERSSTSTTPALVSVMMSNRLTENKGKMISLLLTGDPKGKVEPDTVDQQSVHDAIIAVIKNPQHSKEDIELLTNTFRVPLSEVQSAKGETLAMVALEKGNMTLFNELRRKAQPDSQHTHQLLKIALNGIREQEKAKRAGKESYQPALYEALVKQVKDWINNNPQLINKPFEDGTTPLMRAADSGATTIATLLLEKMADIHAIKSGSASQKSLEPERTALHYAIRSENHEMINLMAEKGADLTVPNEAGKTALQIMVSQYRPTLAQVSELMSPGQKLTDIDAEGNTLLHTLVQRSGAEKSLDLIQGLIKEGLDPCQKNNAGETPLAIVLRDTSRNIPVAVAMLETVSAKELRQDKSLQQAVKPLKAEILSEFKATFKDTDFRNAESKAAARERLGTFFDKKNALARIYRSKIRVDKPEAGTKTTPQSLLNRFRWDDAVMKELKAFKEAFLDDKSEKRSVKKTPTRQWRNL